MKQLAPLFLSLIISSAVFAQKELVRIPEGVVYNYCKPKKFEKAKDLVLSELVLNKPSYQLVSESFFVGPVLWNRVSQVDSIQATKSTKVNLHIDEAMLEARFFQSQEQAMVLWNHIRHEFNGIPMRLRKANYQEINYYWTVISYDIDEPLIIAETPSRQYILDINLKTMSLKWLDEMPENFDDWFDEKVRKG